MSILTLFVVIPVLMLLGLWLSRNLNQVRGVMVVGSSCLLVLSVWLTIAFLQMRDAGNTDAMLFQYTVDWFKPLNIAYAVAVEPKKTPARLTPVTSTPSIRVWSESLTIMPFTLPK